MQLDQKTITTFQKEILSWYEKNKRDLPWRHTDNPYNILLSEIMSQQTQISRVVEKYIAWIKELPTIEVLADAPLSEILRLWSGLGYNRRALFLQKTAQAIVLKKEWPDSVEELKKLPGIGQYTASAIACFAFHKQIAVVDTNIRKVISYHFFHGELPEEKHIEQVAIQLVPHGRAEEWNQALMDYAGMELKNHKIPIPKQSKLFGSNRYYRGQLLKLLLQKEQTINDCMHFFSKQHASIEKEKLEKIIKELLKEGLIKQKDSVLFL